MFYVTVVKVKKEYGGTEMKKRTIKKLALLMAAVMCLAMAPQSMMPAKAASASTYSVTCPKCGNAYTVEVRTIKLGETEPVKCTEASHISSGCYVIYDICEDQYWITCITCGKSERNGSSQHEETKHLFWYC